MNPEASVPTVFVPRVAARPVALPIPFMCVGRLVAGHIDSGDGSEDTGDLQRVLVSDPQINPNEAPDQRLQNYVTRRTSQGVRCYLLHRFLRKTLFGEIYSAQVVEPVGNYYRAVPNQFVAVKIYKREKLARVRQGGENPRNELAVMQLMPQHDNIVSLQDSFVDSDENIYGVMDYCSGTEMFHLVKPLNVLEERTTPLSENVARKRFREVLGGLNHIHRNGFAHRDVSMENVMTTTVDRPTCKIIDFGMCVGVPRDGAGNYFLMPAPHAVGKLGFMAPEVIESSFPFNPMVSDIWALGIILFILLTGHPPVEYAHDSDARFRLITGRDRYWLARPTHRPADRIRGLLQIWNMEPLSPQVYDLLGGILQADPGMRYTLNEIITHPWLNNS